jgi:5-methylcytosine-specific restriction endonuclease McrA
VLRLAVLKRDPMCTVDGCEQESVEVDHLVPRARGGASTMENCRGICVRHHRQKTARESKYGRWRGGQA